MKTENSGPADGDWNYRMYRHSDGEYEIVEVIYGGGKPDGFTEMFALRGETRTSLFEVYGWVGLAFSKPVLTRIDFGLEQCCDEHAKESVVLGTPQTDGHKSNG